MNAPTELLTAFRDSFVRALDEEMGVEDFLALLQGRSHGVRQRARVRARGDRQAQAGQHCRRCASVAHLPEPRHPDLGCVRGLPWHGRNADVAVRVLPARRSGSRGTQAGAVSARPCRWRQVFAGGEDQVAVRAVPDLYAEGHGVGQGLPAARVAVGTVSSRQVRRADGRPVWHSAPSTDRHRQPVGAEAPEGIQRRSVPVQGRPHHAVGAEPDRHRQDGARRREHAGHLVAGRQGRPAHARAVRAGRSGRVQLLGRALPGFGALHRVRRDVQGAA